MKKLELNKFYGKPNGPNIFVNFKKNILYRLPKMHRNVNKSNYFYAFWGGDSVLYAYFIDYKDGICRFKSHPDREDIYIYTNDINASASEDIYEIESTDEIIIMGIK